MTTKIASGYARAEDGAYIAYQVFGEGSVDIAWQLGSITNLEVEWDSHWSSAWYEGLASYARVILHDRRGTGNSSRNVAPPNLETRAADLRTVLDHVGSTQTVIGGWFESTSPGILLAASDPDRVRGVVWWSPEPCLSWKPNFPWGWDRQAIERELRDVELWGTDAYGEAYADWWEEEMSLRPSDAEIAFQNRAARTTCTPDVALAMRIIEFDTDVRALLPSLQAPTLLIALDPKHREIATYVATLIPSATVWQDEPWEIWPTSRREADDAATPVLTVIQDFLGVQPPRRDLDSVVTTLLFTDIVGSTAMQAKIGDRGWKDLIEKHHQVVRELLAGYRGQEQDTAGDGFFARFDGPARAIHCAQEVVAAVRDLGIEIRAGVHTGECEISDGKCSGISVSIGARVMAHGGASEVLVSQTVKDLVAGSGFTFEDAGEHELKGVPEQWHLYRVVD